MKALRTAKLKGGQWGKEGEEENQQESNIPGEDKTKDDFGIHTLKITQTDQEERPPL